MHVSTTPFEYPVILHLENVPGATQKCYFGFVGFHDFIFGGLTVTVSQCVDPKLTHITGHTQGKTRQESEQAPPDFNALSQNKSRGARKSENTVFAGSRRNGRQVSLELRQVLLGLSRIEASDSPHTNSSKE